MSKLRAAALALTAACTLAACGGDSTLLVENASSFAIIEINLSPVDSATWGADLLGADVLAPGEALEISGIDCGDYDVRVVDEDQDECVLEAVELCFDDAVWRITDGELGACFL